MPKQVRKCKTCLEDQVDQEGHYEDDEYRMPPRAAHRVRHRRRRRISSFGRRPPDLTTVRAFPGNLIFISV